MTDIIVSLFSTFYQVNPHTRQVQDRKLKHNLQSLLRQHPELANETALLKYLCEEAAKNHPDSLALRHLRAYVDSACYAAAIASYKTFKTPELTFEDYLQIARVHIASRAVKLCAKFDRTQSKIQTYLHPLLWDAIMSEVRKHQETQRQSDPGLLRSCSKKALKTALEKVRISESRLSDCLLSWQGFSEVYAPVKTGKNRLLPEITEEQWEAIAQFCTEQQFPQSIKAFTVPEIKALLQTCVKALRSSGQIKFDSLNAENSELELEIIREFEQQSQYQEQEVEKCVRLQQMTLELASAIASFPPDARKMLILEHGFTRFNQSYIGKEFGLRQDRVSKQLTRYKRTLLKSLVQWSQTQTSVTLSVEDIDRLSIHLDEWLTWYCQNAILYKFLQTALKQHPALKLEIPLLYCYYGSDRASARAIDCNLNTTPAEMQAKLAQIKTILQAELHEWLRQILELKPGSIEAINNSSALLVEQFLANAPYALLTR